MEIKLRKVLLVLGCLIFSTYALAEVNCQEVKDRFENQWVAYIKTLGFAETYKNTNAETVYRKNADTLESRASNLANIYNAFCKD